MTATKLSAVTPSFASAVLNALDRRLGEAVEWGFYDLALSMEEIGAILEELPGELGVQWQALRQQNFYDASALVSDFVVAGLLHEDPVRAGHYRTRFAEGVRLLAKLRQMFRAPQWSTAPSLVSDLKVHLAERSYPVRSESARDCWSDLRRLCRHPKLQEAVFDALARSADGQPLKFAGFQRRAFAHILSRVSGSGLTGSVVSAGTGLGKTKAFYIPAFLSAVADIQDDPQPYTKIIAIYPRNVLLADQLREAVAEAAKVRPVLQGAGLRPLTFGALLGDTPPSISSFEPRQAGQRSYIEEYSRGWKPQGAGWAVPFIRSPEQATEMLIWRDVDRRAGRTCLYRANGAVTAPDIPDGEIRLTREQIQQDPPDVLFLSLEMLNQQMGHPDWGRAFGLAANAPSPRLLLLDEVHTYEGVAGAQAAWVLRRWRHWGAIEDLHVVGLSATLQQATRHLSLVAGIPEPEVREFRPRPEELEAVDMEYNIAVKGNPAAGASLLATTIQTAMLLPRVLTPRLAPRTKSDALSGDLFFGRKVFGFTDKLDVLNRWFSDLRDAEVRKHLPRLRQPAGVTTPSEVAREQEGQSWWLPLELGHNLNNHLQITRCSSQDPGANAESDLIVATASLEVGFDDPDVGATLHHKRPRSLASFIQRKGRAGRRRGTRPWTVVVLSDYGGDRWAFQNTETLFRPEVGEIYLPIANSHVLRMQAVYFLIDWVSARLQTGNAYDYLRPSRSQSAGRTSVQTKALQLLRELLEFGDLWRAFRHDFRSVFRMPYGKHGAPIPDSVLDGLLWDAPRPLIQLAVPTLLRKLEASWGYADPGRRGQIEDASTRRPLPQFIPGTTFADLDVGEARLEFPGTKKRDEFLGTGRALLESCPGHVSKRYSVRDDEEGYWLQFSAQLARKDAPPPEVVSVETLYSERLFLDVVDGIHVFEPQAASLQPIDPRLVRDSSSASWKWKTRVRPVGDGQRVPVLVGTYWSAIVRSCVAYLHRDHARVEVLRYAPECRYELRRPNGQAVVGRLRLEGAVAADSESDGNRTAGRPEAVGFRKVVDGISVALEPAHLSTLPTLAPALVAALRADYFRDRLRQTRELDDTISVFLRDWLSQMSLAMLTATAARGPCSLADAQERLRGKRLTAAKKVLESIFQIRDVEALGDEERAKLRRRLEDLWAEPPVVAVLERHERVLWESLDSDFSQWARRRYVATIAQAVRAAAVARVPDVTEDDLALDVIWTADDEASIHLTELESGGVGVIERIVGELRRHPDDFHNGVRYHLQWCPREDLISNLRGIVDVACGVAGSPAATQELNEAFDATRAANTVSAAEEAHTALRAAIEHAGFIPTRPLQISVMTRLLQPGTDAALDSVVQRFNVERDRLTDVLGVEFGAEAFSYYALGVDALQAPLVGMLQRIGGQTPAPYQLYAIAQRMALEACTHSCPECLDQPNIFNDFGRPSRLLATTWLELDVSEVRATAGQAWMDEIRRQLQATQRVRLAVPDAVLTETTRRVQALLAEEVAVGFLLLPISITRVDRRNAEWHLLLQLKEAEVG
jgi:hypothetical protein